MIYCAMKKEMQTIPDEEKRHVDLQFKNLNWPIIRRLNYKIMLKNEQAFNSLELCSFVRGKK